ncbi:MAG: gamma-glutamyl-gamma-aminobutyrate hydrolase family protein, partial [Pseudomonadota bacterium]
LGVCRGFQEINVAMGGSLHQRVHHIPGLADHREPAGQPVEVQFASGHEVSIVEGSVFAKWAGASHARVNSLHGQGIARLAPDLRALVHAPDGLIEGFEISNAAAFAYAVQWHPEWRFWETPFYAAILEAFGQACTRRQALRLESQGLKQPNSTLQFAAGSI